MEARAGMHVRLRARGLALFLLPVLPVFVFALQGLRIASMEPFWSDEMFSYFMAGRPEVGLRGVLAAVWDGRDGMMPLFYLVHFYWGATLQPVVAAGLGDRLPWASEFAWRLPSLLLALAGSGLLAWRLSRRVGAAFASAVVALALLASPVVLLHVAGFRGYGMMLGLACALLAALDRWTERPSRAAWLAVALVAAAMAMTHLMGFVFAITAIAGVALGVRAQGRRTAACLAMSLPAAALVAVCLPMLVHTARLATPWSWVPVPAVPSLPQGYLSATTDPWLAPSLLAAAAAAFLFPRRKGGAPCWNHTCDSLKPVVIAWLLLPPAAFLASQFLTPVFLDRYLLPVCLAAGLLGASALRAIGGGMACAILTVSLSLGNLVDAAGLRPSTPPPSEPHATPLYPRESAKAQPVTHLHMTDNLHQFLRAAFYGGEPGAHWLYIHDLPSAQDPDAGEPRRLSNEIQILLAHARTWGETGGVNGIPDDRLLPLEEFGRAVETARNRQFRIVVDRTLDQRALRMAAAMLESTGWVMTAREIVAPPRGSPSPAIERTLWQTVPRHDQPRAN